MASNLLHLLSRPKYGPAWSITQDLIRKSEMNFVLFEGCIDHDNECTPHRCQWFPRIFAMDFRSKVGAVYWIRLERHDVGSY